MPSAALATWQTGRLSRLDELESAHAAVGGSGPGRRYATEQINRAYVVAISSQFQAFCRDLHSEAAIFLVGFVAPSVLQPIFLQALESNRQLDRGNVQPGSLGSDFGRFGIEFWDDVIGTVVRGRTNLQKKRQLKLEQLNIWRNQIAHSDALTADEQRKVGKTKPTLQNGRRWRSACEFLAIRFDQVIGDYVENLVQQRPW
jgi:hypothetical protein